MTDTLPTTTTPSQPESNAPDVVQDDEPIPIDLHMTLCSVKLLSKWIETNACIRSIGLGFLEICRRRDKRCVAKVTLVQCPSECNFFAGNGHVHCTYEATRVLDLAEGNRFQLLTGSIMIPSGCVSVVVHEPDQTNSIRVPRFQASPAYGLHQLWTHSKRTLFVRSSADVVESLVGVLRRAFASILSTPVSKLSDYDMLLRAYNMVLVSDSLPCDRICAIAGGFSAPGHVIERIETTLSGIGAHRYGQSVVEYLKAMTGWIFVDCDAPVPAPAEAVRESASDEELPALVSDEMCAPDPQTPTTADAPPPPRICLRMTAETRRTLLLLQEGDIETRYKNVRVEIVDDPYRCNLVVQNHVVHGTRAALGALEHEWTHTIVQDGIRYSVANWCTAVVVYNDDIDGNATHAMGVVKHASTIVRDLPLRLPACFACCDIVTKIQLVAALRKVCETRGFEMDACDDLFMITTFGLVLMEDECAPRCVGVHRTAIYRIALVLCKMADCLTAFDVDADCNGARIQSTIWERVRTAYVHRVTGLLFEHIDDSETSQMMRLRLVPETRTETLVGAVEHDASHCPMMQLLDQCLPQTWLHSGFGPKRYSMKCIYGDTDSRIYELCLDPPVAVPGNVLYESSVALSFPVVKKRYTTYPFTLLPSVHDIRARRFDGDIDNMVVAVPYSIALSIAAHCAMASFRGHGPVSDFAPDTTAVLELCKPGSTLATSKQLTAAKRLIEDRLWGLDIYDTDMTRVASVLQRSINRIRVMSTGVDECYVRMEIYDKPPVFACISRHGLRVGCYASAHEMMGDTAREVVGLNAAAASTSAQMVVDAPSVAQPPSPSAPMSAGESSVAQPPSPSVPTSVDAPVVESRGEALRRMHRHAYERIKNSTRKIDVALQAAASQGCDGIRIKLLPGIDPTRWQRTLSHACDELGVHLHDAGIETYVTRIGLFPVADGKTHDFAEVHITDLLVG